MIRLHYKSAILALCLLPAILLSCTKELADNRETDYGYVQFKLYKAASYEPASKASNELEYLHQACKIKVEINYEEQTLSQTLVLSAADTVAAEYGLRSDKLKLLAGQYTIISYTLYDALDNELCKNAVADRDFQVIPGGLVIKDLTADVVSRGRVKFSLEKDLSDFNPPTRGAGDRTREYTFDEIKKVSIRVENKANSADKITFEELPATYSEYFDENGIWTSSIVCDTLLSIKGGTYKIISYTTFDTNNNLLETHEEGDEGFRQTDFTVNDNKTTEAAVNVTMYEADEYLKDNYALYEIWKALNGPSWSYQGEGYPLGCNWNFDKDPDLWSAQPGVEVHSNGRVAKIVLSEFGISGPMPPAIGQLTELVELYIGSHNDVNNFSDDPLSPEKSIEERNRNRMENNGRYLKMLNPAPQMSAPCALALREHNLYSDAVSSYDSMTEKELAAASAGKKEISVSPKDVIPGKICNGLTSLPEEIGNLTKLEYLYIANSTISTVPESLSKLISCTDIELYNCPNLKSMPSAIAEMPALISVNISANPQWSASDTYNAIDALSNGASKDLIQILYARDNNLEKLPKSLSNMQKLGMLDLSNNKITGLLPALGKEFAPVQIYFDNNRITGFEDGVFCMTDDLETISLSYNRLTEFPNIFTSKTDYVISSVNLAYNDIESFPSDKEFNGIKVTTLSLGGNKIKKFPTCLAASNSLVEYILLNGCGMEEIPEGCFGGENGSALISMDLTYNHLKKLPDDFVADNLPYLYGVDLSYNSFKEFPFNPLTSSSLTVFAIRGQRDENGNRCLQEWPVGIYKHTGLRGFFIGSNDLRKIDDTISYLIYNLDISDNPNITFDASDICYYWQAGAFNLIYDKSQNIVNCEAMLEE